jgi:hypothetical protein
MLHMILGIPIIRTLQGILKRLADLARISTWLRKKLLNTMAHFLKSKQKT